MEKIENPNQVIVPFRELYINLLKKLNQMIDNGYKEIDQGLNDHKSFGGLLYDLRELHEAENENFAKLRRLKNEKVNKEKPDTEEGKTKSYEVMHVESHRPISRGSDKH